MNFLLLSPDLLRVKNGLVVVTSYYLDLGPLICRADAKTTNLLHIKFAAYIINVCYKLTHFECHLMAVIRSNYMANKVVQTVTVCYLEQALCIPALHLKNVNLDLCIFYENCFFVYPVGLYCFSTYVI